MLFGLGCVLFACSASNPTGAGGTGGTGGAPSIPPYTLRVDSPSSGATLTGVVTLRGLAPGFVNVELWDSTHQHPPLAQTTPSSDGSFSVTVDTANLSSGATTWTVWAWDSSPGQPATHQASADLSLTISNGAGTGGTGGTGGSGGTGGTGGTGGGTSNETVGTGDINSPARGPAPFEAARIGGAPFVLVKNWNFGSSGTIPNMAALTAEFQYHDQWGTIDNGGNYGAVTVAPSAATAISGQPVEDPSRPYRELTPDVLRTFVRPLSTSQSSVSPGAHNAGNGSITAKWHLPTGGSRLGRDLIWETRVRMPETEAAYWFAIWTAGTVWNHGAEMDVLESFGTPNIYPPPAAFHVNSVGGTDNINYSSWPNGLNAAGVPTSARDLRQWHTFSWLYRKDDTYAVYYDGYTVQTGNIHWTSGGSSSAATVDLWFIFDFGWGHTQVQEVNTTLPASGFNITYETDYSRVYLR